MRTKIINLPSSADTAVNRSVLRTDKNAELGMRKRNDLSSPHGGSVMGRNVKWAFITKEVACQPGNAIGKKVSK